MAETHGGKNYEYRDHTADVQIHSWGSTLKEAFEACAVGLFGYMIEVEKVDIDESLEATEFEVSGEDLESLLYEFLEEFIFIFTTELLVFKDIKLTVFDTKEFKIKAVCRGEKFSKAKHGQGTEIKAITYSAMQIIEQPEKSEIYVIVDI